MRRPSSRTPLALRPRSDRLNAWREYCFDAAGSLRVPATATMGIFAAVLTAEHIWADELVPTDHMVSEYATSGTVTGALMVGGFMAWALSLLTVAGMVARFGALVTVGPLRRAALRFAGGLLLIAAGGALVTGVFPTQTTAGQLPPGQTLTVDGRVHDLGSGITALALAAAAVLSVIIGWGHRRYALTVLGMLLIVGLVSACLLAFGDPVPGIRQRVQLVVALVWQAITVRQLAHGFGPCWRTTPRAS